MGIDRIIQLKIALDTGELVSGMDETTGKIDGLAKQAGGFIKSAGIGLALEGLDKLVTKTGEAVTREAELEVQTAQLARALNEIGASESATDVLAEVSRLSREFGFDETEATTALNTIMLQAGSTEEAMIGLERAMDLTRGSDELTDLAAGAELVRDVFAGDVTRSVDDFGAAMDENADAVTNLVDGFAAFDGAAADFAGTTAGMEAQLDQTINQGFGDLAAVLQELKREILPVIINDLLPALGEAWQAIQPAVQAFLELLQAVWELIKTLEPVWGPILDAAMFLVERVFGNMVEDIEKVTAIIQKVIEAITALTKKLKDSVGTIKQTMANIKEAMLAPLREVQAFIDGFDPIGSVKGFVGDLNPFDGSSTSAVGSSTGGTVVVNVRGDAAIVETAVTSALQRTEHRSGRNNKPFRRTV